MSAIADSPTSDQAVAGSTPVESRANCARASSGRLRWRSPSPARKIDSGDGSPACAAIALIDVLVAARLEMGSAD